MQTGLKQAYVKSSKWNDGAVTFTMDAQLIDPNNCWAVILDDNEQVLQVLKIGQLDAIQKDIRRPLVSNSKYPAILFNEFLSSSAETTIEFDFLFLEGSWDIIYAVKNGYSDRIAYDKSNAQWLLRSGYKKEIVLPASKEWADGQQHHLKISFTESQSLLEIDGQTEGVYSEETGSNGPITVTGMGLAEGADTDENVAFFWNVKLNDINQPSNSRYYKFDEQVGSENNHIIESISGLEGTVTRLREWSFPPQSQ